MYFRAAYTLNGQILETQLWIDNVDVSGKDQTAAFNSGMGILSGVGGRSAVDLSATNGDIVVSAWESWPSLRRLDPHYCVSREGMAVG